MKKTRGGSAGRELLASWGLLAITFGALAVVEMGLLAPASDLRSARAWSAVLLTYSAVAIGVGLAAMAAKVLAAGLGRLGAARLGRLSACDWALGLVAVIGGVTHGWPLLREPLSSAVGRPAALAVVALGLAATYTLSRSLSGHSPRQLVLPVVFVLAALLGYYLLRSEPLGLPARSRFFSLAALALFATLAAGALAGFRRHRMAAIAVSLLGLVGFVRAAAPAPHALVVDPTPVSDDMILSESGQHPVESRSHPVFLIVVDTLRADAVDLGADSGCRTPHLARLAAHSDVFTRAVANASWTLPAHASLFTGSRVSRHRVDMTSVSGYGSKLTPSLSTVHERFSRRGYGTSCIAANGIVGPASGLVRGCRRYRHPGRAWILQTMPLRLWYALSPSGRPALEDQMITQLTGLRRHATAREVLDFAVGELSATDRPVYQFLNLMDVHRPYPPAADLSREDNRAFVLDLIRLLAGFEEPEVFDREHAEWTRRSYHAQVARLDAELGRFFEILRARGLYDEALIVVTSDHGEAFFDNPELPLYYDHHGAYEAAVRIPLIIKRPLQRAGRRLQHLVEQAEVAVAMMALAAGEANTGPLFETESDRFVLTEWNPHPIPGAMSTLPLARAALYRDNLKLVVEGARRRELDAGGLETLLFDLESSPFEATEIGAQSPRLAARLRSELLEILDREWELGSRADRGDEQADPELLETLRSLGYIE